MPYKHSKIQYGLPHEIYPQESVSEHLELLRETIDLKTEPVAITFLFTKEDYDAYPVEETKTAMTYCLMVKQSAINGRGLKSRLEHHKCDGGTTALALEPSTEKIESGREYCDCSIERLCADTRCDHHGDESISDNETHSGI